MIPVFLVDKGWVDDANLLILPSLILSTHLCAFAE